MQAGRLRTQVQLQRKSETQGATGEPVTSWATIATLPADVTMPGGVERFVPDVDRVVATVTHRVRVRSAPQISPLDRFRLGSRTLEILSAVDPDGRRRETVCMCRELVGA